MDDIKKEELEKLKGEMEKEISELKHRTHMAMLEYSSIVYRLKVMGENEKFNRNDKS